MKLKLLKMKNKLAICLSFALILAFSSVTAFAADAGLDIDMAELVSSGVQDVFTQIMQIIAVIVPVALLVVGAQVAITRGIALFRGLMGR